MTGNWFEEGLAEVGGREDGGLGVRVEVWNFPEC